jgi:signal peptidase II
VQAATGAPLSQPAGQAGPGGDGDLPAPPARRRRVVVLAALALFVLAADAISKALVVAHLRPDQPVHVLGNVFELWLTRNPGAAFSVGTGETAVFTLIAFGVIVYIARTARKLYSVGWAIALGLLLGGAMGNLGDRIFREPGLFRGYVVDWIGVVPRYYPIFNLADSAIVCGGILTVILAMRGFHLDGTRGEPEDGDAAEAGGGGAGGADAGTARAEATEPADPARIAPPAGPAGAAKPADPAES